MNSRTLVLIIAAFFHTTTVVPAQDEDRTQAVLDQLNETPTQQSIFDYVGFQLSGEIVILSGFTIQPTLKTEAEKMVRSLNWVKHVVNRIEVLPIEPAGSRIRGRTEEVLKQNVPQAFPQNRADIRIKVMDNDVTLVGSVARIHGRRLESAVSQIERLPSVGSVTNEVRIVDN